MANEEHLARLKEGVAAWNQWRDANRHIMPDLSQANLSVMNLYEADLARADLAGANLREADLRGADLREANLRGADLFRADLTGADLSEANLYGVNLSRAVLTGAALTGAALIEADLHGAHFTGADLSGANLTAARLINTHFEKANLTGCRVYAISAWNVILVGAQQSNVIITPRHEPKITADHLEVAQFIYLLLHNEKIREAIDTITSKAVLILGRFNPPERKAVLEAIREELRRRNYLPIVFDFERPTSQDFTETIMTLAGMCLFIIADITNPKSSPLELQATVPNYMVPFVPIIQEGEQPFSMFKDLKNKHPNWVLDLLEYDSPSTLVRKLGNAVIRPALKKHDELLMKKAEELRIRHVKDYPDDEETL
jgi:hypothetical protein